jgi:cell division septation protein DedD
MSRFLATLGVLFIFAVITFASYFIGKHVIYPRMMQPQNDAAVQGTNVTPPPAESAPRIVSPPSTAVAPPQRVAQATQPKPKPKVVIEVNPDDVKPTRPQPEESQDDSSAEERSPLRIIPPSFDRSNDATEQLRRSRTRERAHREVASEEGDNRSNDSTERGNRVRNSGDEPVRVPKPEPTEAVKPRPRRERRPSADAAETPRPETPSTASFNERRTQPTAPKPKPPAPKNAGSSAHQVQVGAYDEEENARSIAAELQGKGYHAFITKDDKDGKHRVYAGSFKDKQSAERMKGELEQQGYSALVR